MRAMTILAAICLMLGGQAAYATDGDTLGGFTAEHAMPTTESWPEPYSPTEFPPLASIIPVMRSAMSSSASSQVASRKSSSLKLPLVFDS